MIQKVEWISWAKKNKKPSEQVIWSAGWRLPRQFFSDPWVGSTVDNKQAKIMAKKSGAFGAG